MDALGADEMVVDLLKLFVSGCRCAYLQFTVYLARVGIDDVCAEVSGQIDGQHRLTDCCGPRYDYQRFHPILILFRCGRTATHSRLSDNSAFGILDERADVIHLLRVRILGAGFGNTILQYSLGIDDAVGIVDGLDGLVVESATTQPDEVNTSVADGFLACDDVGRNVLRCAATALEHDVAAYAAELVEQAATGNDGAVLDDNLAGNLRGIAYNAAVTDFAVMGDVHILHEQVAVAHDGLTFRSCASADGDILADAVVVANLACGLLAFELEVLGLGGDAGSGEELVPIADACAEMDGDAVQELVVVTDDNILIDDAEGADDVVVT